MSDRFVALPSQFKRLNDFRFSLLFAVVGGLSVACSSSGNTDLGGGGTSAGGSGDGGSPATGGTSAGGNTATGGNPATGGASTGGASTGGAATGGSSTGGATADPGLVGWAAVSGMGVDTTTGGGNATPVTTSNVTVLGTDLAGTTARVVQLTGSVTGDVKIGSNKTLEGASGVTFTGHLDLSGSVNVIIRNLKVVGYNCTDNADCQSGADAISVTNSAHHIWIDHCDISDGSDGNLDINAASDYVTVSWTKFSYSGARSGGHQFSNLVGSADTATGDTNHLNVTWHHDWWANRVNQRMPRIRFGKNHIFNSLYTANGDSYCVGAGVSSNILTENNVFSGVKNPIDSTDYSNGATVVVSRGNVYTNVTGTTADKGTAVFTPPYPYTLDAANTVQTAVQNGAGPQ